MEWSNTFDAVFFISIATLFVGLIKYSMDKCLQSKCEEFSLCWNFFSVKRRVDLEIQQEMKSLELHAIEHREESSSPKSSTITQRTIPV